MSLYSTEELLCVIRHVRFPKGKEYFDQVVTVFNDGHANVTRVPELSGGETSGSVMIPSDTMDAIRAEVGGSAFFDIDGQRVLEIESDSGRAIMHTPHAVCELLRLIDDRFGRSGLVRHRQD